MKSNEWFDLHIRCTKYYYTTLAAINRNTAARSRSGDLQWERAKIVDNDCCFFVVAEPNTNNCASDVPLYTTAACCIHHQNLRDIIDRTLIRGRKRKPKAVVPWAETGVN